MLRRTALKKLGILTGGLILLPSCNFSEEKASVILKSLNITAEQEKVLKAIVDTLIPEGEIPGAISLGVDHFVWIMVDDTLNAGRQHMFIKGLSLFNSNVKKESGKSFEKLRKEDQFKTLAKASANNENGEIIDFINTTKYLTQMGYMQSEYIMTRIMPYSLVPRSYGNCVDTDPNKRINIYA
ncbi:MAG: gluconate 2-dehydrogenase subunit 3 family protein [Flavobacteriia bacterium]|nr:MAG: gluconate 2-dehydrogenase subunit 3 family protein [Flavobacteriia bacterium]